MELTPRELQVITQGASNAHSAQRGFIPLPDLINDGVVWALEHPRKVEMWREKGKYGENLLRHSVKQACLSKIAKERHRVYKLERGDLSYYNVGVVRELLPDVFDKEDWTATGVVSNTDKVGGVSRPSEGNTRLAMLCDIAFAFGNLNDDDQALLRDLYADGGVTHAVVAATLDVNEKTVARRERRALDRIVDRLGGESPWWNGRASA